MVNGITKKYMDDRRMLILKNIKAKSKHVLTKIPPKKKRIYNQAILFGGFIIFL